MNLFGLSPGELILIMLVAMIVIGPEKLPETAASVGKWIREFRRVTSELTQQFAEDNPFTEIQRALSFTDEPIGPTTAYTPLETTPASNNVPLVDSSTAISQPAPPVVSLPRRTDYFDRPSYYSAIDDSWVHGALNGYEARFSKNGGAVLPPIADEWTHGVAVAPPVVEEAPVESIDSAVVLEQTDVTMVGEEVVSPVDATVSSDGTNAILGPTASSVEEGSESTPLDVDKPVESNVESEVVDAQPGDAQPETNGVGHLNGATVPEATNSSPGSSKVNSEGVTVGVSEERSP